METFKDFRKRTLRLEGKGIRKHKVTNSYTLRTIYRWNKAHKVIDLDERTYSDIINKVNKLLVEAFFKQGTIRFPHSLGSLYIIKKDTSPFINDKGKLVIPKIIDWDRTLKLWYEDPEAKESKILIRVETPISYKIVYNRCSAKYNNKIFYNFKPCRSLSARCSRIPDLNLLAVERK